MNQARPSWSMMTRVFLRIGLLSFGGPAAQIAVMHKELVEDRPWLSEKEYLSALSFCMLLPGPEAMQLATFAGWKLRGVRGGLIGGGLFVLPGAIVMALLALLYGSFGTVPLVEAMFLGIKAAVVIIVLQALLRLGQRALGTLDRWILAGLSFVCISLLQLPFPLIILAAGLYGFLTATGAPQSVAPVRHRGTFVTIAVWGALWLGPVAVLWLSGAEFLTELALFFSKLAVVTFGGAYAVLAYMAQEVVVDHGWITTAQMMDGLGLAETTPGPLILVTQFVGMVAGHTQGGLPLALAGGLVALWVTFMPCFLWIFAGAPYVEAITARPRLAAALSAITAAVVGVILNLSIWFALHVFFGTVDDSSLGPLHFPAPDVASVDVRAIVLAIASVIFLLVLRWPLSRIVISAAVLGAVLGQI